MVNKCAAPKCTSGYASNEKKQTEKFHFPLRNAELNKQWIHFISKRDWLATKCCVNYILKRNIYGEVKNVQYSGR